MAFDTPPSPASPEPSRPEALPRAGFEVPWRERLSTRLLTFLTAAVLVAVAALYVAETRVEAGLREQLAAELTLVAHTTRGALHRAMLQDRRDDAYRIMEDVARQPGVEALRLMDADGRVTFSTRRAEIGTVLDRAAPGCAGCHAGATPLRQAEAADRSRVTTGPGGRALATMIPFENEPGCATAACHAHPAGRAVLGVLEVGLSLSGLDEVTAGFRWRSLVSSAVVAALLGLAFWLFARRHVVAPVEALVAASHRVARQDLDAEVPETFGGELGLLMATFNEMTRSLRRARAELRALLDGLERQVEERTDALVAARDDLVRTEKLASVGKLAAAVAHEINNPLSGIMTFARLISRNLEAGPPDDATRRTLLRNLGLVQRESERCSDIVRNLLDFAHERPLLLDDLAPDAVVEDALHLVASQLTIQGVTLEKALQPLPRTYGDFARLRQACLNVLMNACEAMPFGGTLTVAGAPAEDGAAFELRFTDTGPGIPPERLALVFDPFFSTKEKAPGLGLSVVHGVVTQHGGTVRLESRVGQGTTVILHLPVRRREGGPAGA